MADNIEASRSMLGWVLIPTQLLHRCLLWLRRGVWGRKEGSPRQKQEGKF